MFLKNSTRWKGKKYALFKIMYEIVFKVYEHISPVFIPAPHPKHTQTHTSKAETRHEPDIFTFNSKFLILTLPHLLCCTSSTVFSANASLKNLPRVKPPPSKQLLKRNKGEEGRESVTSLRIHGCHRREMQ